MRNWLLSCAILLAVTLALRLGLAKKLGPTLRYAIWLPVLIRLLLPVGIGAAGWSVANWGLETEPTRSTSIIQNEPQAIPDLSGADIAFTPDHFTGETTPGTPGLLPTLWVVGAILVGAGSSMWSLPWPSACSAHENGWRGPGVFCRSM